MWQLSMMIRSQQKDSLTRQEKKDYGSTEATKNKELNLNTVKLGVVFHCCHHIQHG